MSDSSYPEPAADYQWHEISDLPSEIEAAQDPELEFLRDMWRVERGRCDLQQIAAINRELAREWAIETGIIEGVYTLDRGITQTLIERGIDAAYIPHGASNRDSELVARIIQTHADVLEGLFAFVNGQRTLSTAYIRELHAALMQNQSTVTVFNQFGKAFEKELERGKYKTMPNNPRRPDGQFHEYCPPEHVASEMDRLVALHHEHMERSVQPQVEAAWLHHAFTQIHPFQDGNGRVARAISSVVLIKGEYFPLVVSRDDRVKYIEALECADVGDLSQLVKMFATIQKRAFTRAIGRSADVRPAVSVDEAIDAIRELLVGLGRITPAEFLKVKATASAIMNATSNALDPVLARLQADIGEANPQYRFEASTFGSPSPRELHEMATRFKYDPNATKDSQSIRLSLKVYDDVSRIVVSLHGVGSQFKGLIAVVAYFQFGEGTPVPLSDDVFRISYQEDAVAVLPRYQTWLDACLIRGLAEWRRTLL